MPVEIVSWLRDVGAHLRVVQKRKQLRKPGQGEDYTHTRFDGLVPRVVEPIHPSRMALRVTEVIRETASARTLRFERTDGPLPPFRPGQYVNLYVEIDGVRTSRPYSISSAPGVEHLDLTVRGKPGGFVSHHLMARVLKGDEMESSGPAGHFYHEPLIDGDDLVFLAGGSGITPFTSLVRDAARRGRKLSIHLVYGSRMPDDVIFGDELARLAEGSDSLRYTPVISEPPDGFEGATGFLDAALLRDLLGEVEGRTFYLCGPNVMLDLCLDALEELGVPPWKIRRELYGPPDDVTSQPGWPEGLAPDATFTVSVDGGPTFEAPAGEPLLNSLERHGVVTPALCRSGECGACRMRLLEGKVFMPQGTGIRESDERFGYVHACAAYPIEDVRVRL